MKKQKTRALIIVLIVLFIASTSLLGAIWQREGYARKVMLKLGLTTQKDTAKDEYALLSWQSCLDSLDYQAGAALFGDSITRGNRWQDYFQEIKVCNLGCSGDGVHLSGQGKDQLAACLAPYVRQTGA